MAVRTAGIASRQEEALTAKQRTTTGSHDQRVILAGTLDTLEHGTASFILVLGSGERVSGRWLGGSAAFGALSRYWGRRVLVHGVLRRRTSGSLLRVDAERISFARGDQTIWSRLPAPAFGLDVPLATKRRQGPRSGVSAIFGRWPGNESDEEVARALEELS